VVLRQIAYAQAVAPIVLLLQRSASAGRDHVVCVKVQDFNFDHVTHRRENISRAALTNVLDKYAAHLGMPRAVCC
jgi:hypothetical protein